jgi:hypothetical protein
MSNIPNYVADNISLGPAVMYVGAAGTTPSLDVGAIHEDGMDFNVTREFLQVFQGSPKQLIKQFVIGETVELNVKTLEWNLLNLPIALGAGVTTSTGSRDEFSFGGDPDTDEIAVRIEHTLPTGQTVSLFVWRAQPIGEWTMNLKQDELHQFPFGFRALQTTVAWDGSDLPVGQQYFRLRRQKV